MWQDNMSLEKLNKIIRFVILYLDYSLYICHINIYILIIHLKIITYAIYTQKIFWI